MSDTLFLKFLTISSTCYVSQIYMFLFAFHSSSEMVRVLKQHLESTFIEPRNRKRPIPIPLLCAMPMLLDTLFAGKHYLSM